MSTGELTDCCIYLESDKVSERKKYCTKLNSILEIQESTNILNRGKPVSWKRLIKSLQKCIKKDAEKTFEDSKKKSGSSNVPANYLSIELFVQVVTKAIKEDGEININELVRYILGCMDDIQMKKCYEKQLLDILQKCILSNSKCRGALEEEDWEEIYCKLKRLLEEYNDNLVVSHCFMILIKYGPTHGLPPRLLRKEFDFMTKICQKVTLRSPKSIQEDIIETALDFCKHTAKDNRVSCCKFGEEIFTSLSGLYEMNGKPEKTKELLVQFFLFQMIIHHPNGVPEGHSAAYANSWDNWKKIVKTIYSIISKEISLYFKCYQKNRSFFKQENGGTSLCSVFSRLHAETVKQLFMCPDLDVSMSIDCSYNPSQKRQKVNLSMRGLIDQIQDSKNWLWIHLVRCLIQIHPSVIEIDDYVALLEILSSIQIEKNEHDIVENVYYCLSTMLHMENSLEVGFHQEKLTKLWKIIGENTTRAFGLNQHKDATEALLEELIGRGIVDFDDILPTYQSDVINLSLQSIRTYNAGLHHMILNNDLQKKECIIRSVLKPQTHTGCHYLRSKDTAAFLVRLILKQWQSKDQQPKSEAVDEYDRLKEIYFKSLLDEETLTLTSSIQTTDVKASPDIQRECVTLLATMASNFVTDNDSVEVLLSKIALLVNIASCVTEYQIMSEEDSKSCWFEMIKGLFEADTLTEFNLTEYKSEREIKRLIDCVNILNDLFSLDVAKWTMDNLKELFPFQLLKKLFDVLNRLQIDQNRSSTLLPKLKICILQALSSFGCLCGNVLSTNQKNVLEVLAVPNYSNNNDDDYKLCMSFLKTVTLSQPGVLTDNILENVLQCIQELCMERYQDKAEDILHMLHGMFPHIAKCRNMEFKNLSVMLLKPFYDNIKRYGPSVKLALLNCLQKLCELDPCSTFTKWEGTEIIRFVPDFLISDYQEVRLKSIDVLVTYYNKNSDTSNIEDIHRQEEIFVKVYEMSVSVFNIDEITTNERRVDEVISRTASVLLTFGEIATNCDNWIEESIYSLMKIAYTKNIDSLDKIIKIINKRKFQDLESNILETYISYLIQKWCADGYSFENFQYTLFNCSTKYEFFKKYFSKCAPILMTTDAADDIMKVAKELLATDTKLVEKTAAKIFTRIICSDLDNMTANILVKNKSLLQYSKVMEHTSLKDALQNNLDQIVVGILEFLTDENGIKSHFGETVIFFVKNLSSVDVGKCFKFLETFLCNNEPLANFLTSSNLSKFENVLLELKCNIYKSQVFMDKLKCLYAYRFFVNMITSVLTPDSSWRYFFIRDVINTLFNIIDNNQDCTRIETATFRFLNNFLRQIFKFLATKDFFHDTVSSLKKFYVTKSSINKECKELLVFLVVDNARYFEEQIKTLDSFPDHEDFYAIRKLQKKIKYGDQEPGVEEEIEQFLNHKDILTKGDSLHHLREILCDQKDKLTGLYDKLQNIRGFSEDCEQSLVHRLVCTLSQLSYSADQNVSFEAARCLGEIGPINLHTLVLQAEKNLVHVRQSPFEVICGTSIFLLTKYLIDCDEDVIRKSSKMLYVALETKEGKKLVGEGADLGYGPINKNYVIPYYPTSSSRPQKVNVDLNGFIEKIDSDELWCPRQNVTHNSWINLLISSMLETFVSNDFLNGLKEICKSKVEFSEHLLPLVVNLLVSVGHRSVITTLSKNIEYFFSEHWRLTVRENTKEELIAVNKKSVKCMLNVVNYVRLMKNCNPYKSRPLDELTVNSLKVAKAAAFCANHFCALYYSELWCQQIVENLQSENPVYCEQRSTMIDFIYEHEEPEVGETLHNILRNAYKSIGDFDALPGCGISFLLQPKYRVEHYKEQGKFDQVIQFYANATTSLGSSSKELMDSFKSNSLYQIPVICSKLDEPEYECLWRLGHWSFEEKKRNVNKTTIVHEDFEKYRFYSLKALHDNNQCAFEESFNCQLLNVVNDIKNISLESSHNLYPALTQLQSLVEIEDFYCFVKNGNRAPLTSKWKLQDKFIRKNDFQYVEPIFTQRLVMLRDYLQKEANDDVMRQYVIDLSLDFANRAKDEGHFKESSTILENLKGISGLNSETLSKIDLVDVQLSWSVNNTLVARQILNRLCKSDQISPRLKATALKLTGQYLSETNAENSSTIISDYFLASIQQMGTVRSDVEDRKNVMDTYDKLALFADREYVQIMTYMKSDLFQKKIATMEQSKKAASSIQNQRDRTYEEAKAAAVHTRNSSIDEQEIESTKMECNQFLKLALKYYLLCLVHSDDKDIRIFRIMSLFLENRKNLEISDTIKAHLPSLPSYKYIVMLPQLIPHLSTDNEIDIFNKYVSVIIEKCAMEHPHHTLPLLLSLANAHKDREFDKVPTKTSSNDARIATAKELIRKLRNKGLSQSIDRLNQVSTALINLAYFEHPKGNNDTKKEYDIPRNQIITKIENYVDVLVPTYQLPVSVKKDYSNIVGIVSFKSKYKIAGGVNVPKRILCRGTDGKYHSQLVKGKDDLRQDAVMQQVFNIMNNLLSYNKTTKHLRIRTYKIVPLSMRSGILKWADDSMPIGEYLTGNGKDNLGAHQKYRPTDKSPNTCKSVFLNCARKSPEVKLEIYKRLCKDLKPVFHHFFEEFFSQPAIWYERRRAFIHSVATTSMCGYILGIGDRHTSNILIDKTTAEVIHIDFGIAFEQGRVLPTPETVPFRLTRDMVDAMGVSGVEGIFRKSCERTMEVLRQNAQTINTILEVLLYDPLYAWTVTSAEANKRQTEGDEEVEPESTESPEVPHNVSAERALLRLREKLQGTELGHPRSIEHQVGALIQQAVDPSNLSRLYHGWQPYI
ncbi:serine-protein kinase ATM-like [Diabrotica virgifera virgifera]|uniref:non-specific serine/threonine protein kinase n=1 Tax=Diabrotica virgifera virgifera TaxID=50390 RepID=A0ABM5IPL2_DIAVI|nr:serine-protein kinase ATM-like [Diabrotica virgifera virgifera]